MTFFNKIKWVLGVLLVFVLIVVTNLIDRNNFLKMRDTVASIYEDRLVANDIILELMRSIQEKEIALVAQDTAYYSSKSTRENVEIDGLLRRFEVTKLTGEEAKVFSALKENVEGLKKAESTLMQNDFSETSTAESLLIETKNKLYDLSKIQLTEGGRQMSISQRAIDTVELFTQIEIYLLIFLAVAIQLIVMYQPSKKS